MSCMTYVNCAVSEFLAETTFCSCLCVFSVIYVSKNSCNYYELAI